MSSLSNESRISIDERIKQEQLELLDAHRKTLHLYRLQLAKVGMAYVLPQVIHGIDDARYNITRIKMFLRNYDCVIEDFPGEENEPVNINIIHSGFSSLREIIENDVLKNNIRLFKNGFQDFHSQIMLMSMYKEIHDDFQNLEATYQTVHILVYHNNGRPITYSRISWMYLERSIMPLAMRVGELLEHAEKYSNYISIGLWKIQIEQAIVNLENGIANRLLEQVLKSTRVIEQILATEPSRINERIIGGMEVLTQLGLENRLISLRDKIREIFNERPKDDIEIFSNSIFDMIRLQRMLIKLVESHHLFQEVDNHLRRIDINLEKNSEDLYCTWPNLWITSKYLCENNTESWSIKLYDMGFALDRYIEERRSFVFIHRCFIGYRSIVQQAFNRVDKNLLKLFDDFRKTGDSLNMIIGMIDNEK